MTKIWWILTRALSNFKNVYFDWFLLCEVYIYFFNCYLAVPRPTFGHSQGDVNPMLITAFVHVQPKGHREPRNKVGSLSPAERLVGFEPGTFRFLLQRLNPLGHSLQKSTKKVQRGYLWWYWKMMQNLKKTCGSENDMRNLAIFIRALENVKIEILMGCFCQK